MYTNDGFIKLPRSISSWRWYTDGNVLRLYIHLFIKAAYKQGEWRTEKIEKGQVVTSRKRLSLELNMSESMVTRILKKLEGTGEIKLNPNNKYTVITLLKWAEYQETDYFFTGNRTTSEQQPNGKRTHTNKENKVNKLNKSNGAPARGREKNKKASNFDFAEINRLIEEGLM